MITTKSYGGEGSDDMGLNFLNTEHFTNASLNLNYTVEKLNNTLTRGPK